MDECKRGRNEVTGETTYVVKLPRELADLVTDLALEYGVPANEVFSDAVLQYGALRQMGPGYAPMDDQEG